MDKFSDFELCTAHSNFATQRMFNLISMIMLRLHGAILIQFSVTLNIDNDIDLVKVSRAHLGSYLKNCWADHHKILTQDLW